MANTTQHTQRTFHHALLERDFPYRIVSASKRGVTIELLTDEPNVKRRRFLTYRQAEEKGIMV